MKNEDKIPLIIINGPTAVGKTKVSVELAKRINGEIISADSMQVFRGMDIGTAKIKPEEMQGIKHHMIDIIEPDEEFSVIRFKELAAEYIKDIASRGKIPIIAGGTGYYIQAVLYDIEFKEYDDASQGDLRKRLEAELADKGALYMHEYLRSFDPESAQIIHMNNTKKLLHAIEFYELTGMTISRHNAEQAAKDSPYDFMYFVITDDRDEIYHRINIRVEEMIEEGLVEEVRELLNSGYSPDLQSMQGIGYKETVDYLEGRVTLEEAVNNIKLETRHYAKKQLTWFKREKKVEFIDRRDYANHLLLADELERRFYEHYKGKLQ